MAISSEFFPDPDTLSCAERSAWQNGFDARLKMKVYLSGPMRGLPGFNFSAFDYAATKLRAEGYEVFSPAEHDAKGDGIRDWMLVDTAWICQHAEAVALLPGWEHSLGARAERALGEAIGATIIILGEEYAEKI